MNRLLAAALLAAPGFSAFAGEAAPALTPEQAAEVRQIVGEVLADANQRATMASGAMTAGIDEKGKVFLKSEDGMFELNLKGRIQFRYHYNEQTDRAPASGGESIDGFTVRRTKLTFEGKVGDPSVKYNITLATDRKTGAVETEEAWMATSVSDTITLSAGKMKLPFAREELISSGKQMSVDRALVTEYYTLNRGLAVQAEHWQDQFRTRVAIHSGGNTESAGGFNGNAAEFAVAGRTEFLALGTAKDVETNVGIAADKQALLFGAAVDWEKAQVKPAPAAPFPANTDNVLSATADVTWKIAGWAFSGAVFNSWVDRDFTGYGSRDLHTWGVVASADYRINDAVDVFFRWEKVDDDATGAASAAAATAFERGLEAFTVGVNYQYNKNVKLSADVVYIYNSDAVSATKAPLSNGQFSDGLGLVSGINDNNDVIAVRLQAQLEF